MKQELKIVIGYVLLLSALGAVAYIFPHREFDVAGIVNVSLQLLLALLSVLIMKNTDDASQRAIFFFSSLYFGSGLLLLLSSFAGSTFLTGSMYGSFFYHLYVNKAGLALFASLAVFSIAVDLAFRSLSALRKSVLTIALAALLVFSFFSPFISDPFDLYRVRDYRILTGMAHADSVLRAERATAPSDADLAAAVRRGANRGTALAIAGASDQELLSDVVRLRSYLQEGGLTTAFWRPLDLAVIYVHASLLAVIAALLIVFYRMNSHLGAYVDKILILFFLFFSMEIFHAAGLLIAPNAEEYHVIFGMGQYFTIFCLLLMVYAYDLKLRFVLSAAGKYYEFALRQFPENVTRWRDEFDRLILRAFVKRNHGNDTLGIFSKSDTKTDEWRQ